MAKGDVEAALEAAAWNTAQQAVELEPGKRYAFVLPGTDEQPARVEQVDTTGHAGEPERSKGELKVHTADGFVTAVGQRINVEGLGWSLYADEESIALVAVLNDDWATPDNAGSGWRDYRVRLDLRRTPEWQHWIAHQGLRDQQAFADAIEHGLDEIRDPSPTVMLEIAQRFEASVNARFKQVNRLRDGTKQLVYEEEVDATAGEVTIPDEFAIEVEPFYGSGTETVTARLKFRMSNGKLQIGYELVKPDRVERSAYQSVRDQVVSELNRHPIEGVAPAATS